MVFTDEYNFDLLKNEAEILVIKEIEQQLKKEPESTCRCNECVVDMAAVALNNIKPLYRFSLLGTLYAQAISQLDYANSVRMEVTEAIKRVRENPAHD